MNYTYYKTWNTAINIMAKVTGAFFSTWASGSVAKAITVRACFNDNKFVMAGYKRAAGKRHEIQIHNSEVFKSRGAAARLGGK